MSAPNPIHIEHIEIEALVFDKGNPRRISGSEEDALDRSIREFEFVDPVLARRDNLELIAGHQRVRSALRLGITTVPAILLDISEERARVLAVALNRIGGEFDDTLLARRLLELKSADALDLTLSGFSDDDIHGLLRGLDARERRDRLELFDVDAAIADASRQTRAKRGDVFRLGDHVLLCGDATDAGDVAVLLGATRPSLAFVDPPYNVAMGDHGGQARGATARRILNDDLEPSAWDAFVRSWASTLISSTDGAIYACMSSREWPTVARVLAEAGGHWSDTIIWQKDRFVLGRADYQRAYEPIWYGWREGVKHYWCGDRDQADVWDIDRPSASPLHPTMKPLELVERAIENSSRPGDFVLDLFVGSGTSIIACERTGRQCRAMDLDPTYVDVAIARWERFSGRSAELVTDLGAVR